MLTGPVKWVWGWEHTWPQPGIIILTITITSMFPFLWGSTDHRKSITTGTSIWNLWVGCLSYLSLRYQGRSKCDSVPGDVE